MTPRRRPMHRDDLAVELTLKRAADIAPEVELGWSIIRQEMRDAGWPARSNGGGNGVRIVSRCRDCGELLEGSAAKDEHEQHAGHHHFDFVPLEPSIGPDVIDYADPTGDLAMRLDHLADDLDAVQFHWQRVLTSLRAVAGIARRYIPPSAAHIPACSVTTCTDTVEQTANGNYRGMERIAGHWVAKPGVKPTCRKHAAR